MKEVALVFKNDWPWRARVALLSSSGERFDGIVRSIELVPRLRPGYQIAFSRCPSSVFPKLTNVEIQAVPPVRDYTQLQFWHQLLKISATMLPVGQVSLEAAQFLQRLLLEERSWSVLQQQILTCHLLSLLGFYPTLKTALEHNLAQQVANLSSFKTQSLLENFEIAQFLRRWLVELATEPEFSWLKTNLAV